VDVDHERLVSVSHMQILNVVLQWCAQ
jgi:hypothetical protein